MTAREMQREARATPSYIPEALPMALEIVFERIGRLAKEDRDDLFELAREWPSAGNEGQESIIVAIREILEQKPVTVRVMDLETGCPEALTGLRNWKAFVSERLKSERQKAELTQAELAAKSGLPQSHISRLESGKHSPSRLTLEKIAEALGVPVSTFDPSA